MFSALPPKADLRQASNDITFGDLQLRTRTGCGHRAPTTVRRSAISTLAALQRVVCAWLLIAVSSAAAASDLWLFVGARERDPYRDRVRGRASLGLIDLGFLVSHASYLAFMQASLTVLKAYNWTDPERTN